MVPTARFLFISTAQKAYIEAEIIVGGKTKLWMTHDRRDNTTNLNDQLLLSIVFLLQLLDLLTQFLLFRRSFFLQLLNLVLQQPAMTANRVSSLLAHRQPATTAITSHRVQSSVFSKESLEKWTSLERYLRQLPNLTNISQLTGHVACFTLMTTRTDPLCQARGEEETTSYHFPGICTVWLEYRSFANHIMKPKALHMVRPSTLLWFARASRKINNIQLHRGWAWSEWPQCWSPPKVKQANVRTKPTVVYKFNPLTSTVATWVQV